jgi:hypothetical protein
MTSADFCILTIPITQYGAVQFHFLPAVFRSYLTDRAGHPLPVPGYLGTGTLPVISLEIISYCIEYRSPRIRT